MMFQDEFVRFYGWGIIVKYHMALYTVGLVSAAGAVRWLMGHRELPVPMLVEMLLVSAAVAALESWILPFDREWEGGTLLWRTVLWTLVCNLGFAGGGALLGWFSGMPLWGSVLLILFLELCLAAVWFADCVALRRESRKLNRGLRKFQPGDRPTG